MRGNVGGRIRRRIGFAACGTQAGDFESLNGREKLVPPAQLLKDILDTFVSELHGFPTLTANQVIMLMGRDRLVVAVEVVRMDFTDQAQALQQIQRTVNSCPGYRPVAIASALDDICRLEVGIYRRNDADNSLPATRQPVSCSRHRLFQLFLQIHCKSPS